MGVGLALGGPIAAAQLPQLPAGQTVRGFRVPDYHPDGTLKSVITGDTARALGNERFEITNLRIELFRDGVVETRVTAPQCVFDRRTQEVSSKGAVRIVRGEVVITGEGFVWSGADPRFAIERNARVVLRRSTLQGLRPDRTEETPP